MKHTTNRITALVLVLLMTASLLASCSEGGETENADTYVGENVDLGLVENEILMDIIELNGELRATVGITSDELTAKYGTEYGTAYGIPYKTQYRYYSMNFVEDTSRREDTETFHQITQASDPTLNLAIGGEPYVYTDENGKENNYGVRYRLYKDGEELGDVLNPKGANNYGPYTCYGARANVVMVEEVPYAWIDYKTINNEIYVNDHFLKTEELGANVYHYVCGLMEIGGTPYALVYAEQQSMSQDYTIFLEPVWRKTLLIPLNPETTELTLEGIEIDGTPTGGAFSDGAYGYYVCGSEIWRTDGESSQKISELIYCGLNVDSEIRAVRTLSDGRLAVVANDGLVLLVASDSMVPAQREVYTIGVLNTEAYVDDLAVTVSKFNATVEDFQFVVKGYREVTKLNLALLIGEVDIIATADRFALKNYIKQDLLAPLEEVVPELFEEGVLIENIVDATREDGTCYYLPREFAIEGRVLECRLAEGELPFETRQEYYDFIRGNDSHYLKSVERKFLFSHMAPTLDEWIDWEANTCHFDDGSFEATLVFCNEGAPSLEIALMSEYSEPLPWYPKPAYSGSFFMSNLIFEPWFADVESAKEYVAGLENGDPEVLPETNEDGWAWVAHHLPSAVHEGFAIGANRYFAVVDKAESREAAGAFLRWHFLEDVVGEIAPDYPGLDYNDYNIKQVDRFSINQAECERFVGRNLAWDGSNKEARLALEQRKYEDTWKIIRQADHLQYFDNAVFRVMNEEAYRYFDGEITASQAADYVQNRVSLYLAEQG